MKKKRKKQNLAKKLMSSILAMTMALEMTPCLTMAVNAEVDEKLVNALAEAYDGDEARAREELEALYESGIIDENGNMVALDIQEDGQPCGSRRRGKPYRKRRNCRRYHGQRSSASQEQLLKISQTKSTLELVQMLSEDVEITDEHVENLESLIEGIADGSVDINSAIESGSLSVNNQKSAPKMKATSFNALNAPLAGTGEPTDDFPETKTGDGEVTADDEGNYTQPLISDSEYDANHKFQLNESESKTYYTDSQYEGIITDGVISLSCADTATAGGTLTVTATLNKAQANPVSFDYAAAGGSIGASGSGTVTWAAGETGAKTFTVSVSAKDGDLWEGKRTFVVGISNFKNATLTDGATAWSKTVSVSANDKDTMPLWVTTDEMSSSTKEGDYNRTLSPFSNKGNTADLYMSYSASKTVSLPSDCPVRLVMRLSGAVPK